MSRLFVYGTLMVPEIMSTVSRVKASGMPAVLSGYRRCLVRDEVFPAIIADSQEKVEGILYQGISDDVWRRVDHFEGEYYQRVGVVVATAAGPIHANTYVIAPTHSHRLGGPWTLAWYMDHGHTSFNAQYLGTAERRCDG